MSTNWGTVASTARNPVADHGEITREVRWVRRMGNPGSPVQEFEELAAATFEAGQFVGIDAAGQIQESGAADTTLLGVATIDASGTAGTLIPVVVGFPDVVFLIECDAAPTITLVGEVHDLRVNVGVHQFDVGAAATSVLRCVGLPVGFDIAGHENENHAYVSVDLLAI